MKTTVAQFAHFINRIDRRQIQFIYFLVMLAGALLLKGPSDGGTGPY